MFINSFFKNEDFHTGNVAGQAIHPSWWSRQYEYPWAFEFVKTGMIVADMGCGYQERPFKNMLATKCKKVYAVDARNEAKSQTIKEPNIDLVIADFSKPIKEIETASLDRIFCLSVLEEGVNIENALTEFARLLKPDGLAILTFDVIADQTKSPGIYKGVNLDQFFQAVNKAGLETTGSTDFSMENILIQPDWNLLVFHCVLRHKRPLKTLPTLDWIERNHPKGSGIPASPRDIAYPEVSGYIIPTLLAHGNINLAKELADWLTSIQHVSGGFRGQDGKLRSFDTAACMEGLRVASTYFSEKEFAIAADKSKKWILDNCLDAEGKVFNQSDKNELRNYSIRVNGLINISPKWFLEKPMNWPFGQTQDRSHYIAYALEGLLALGETEKVKSILNNTERSLTKDGFITYWVEPDWKPSSPFYADFNATSQIGLLLTKLKIKPDLTRKLYENLLNVVKKDGGIPTRPGSIDTSWTAKWFLDFANTFKTK